MKKIKQKKITIKEYNKIMDIIINHNDKPVYEKLIDLIEEASKYEIVSPKKKNVEASKIKKI